MNSERPQNAARLATMPLGELLHHAAERIDRLRVIGRVPRLSSDDELIRELEHRGRMFIDEDDRARITRTCTCVGKFRGPERLGPGWRCALNIGPDTRESEDS